MTKTLRRLPHPQAEIDDEIPAFEPHPWLRGGHAQTIAGRYWLSGTRDIASSTHVVDLDDGDRLSVLESLPGGWSVGDPVAILVHGLAGCARSPYIVRFANRLVSMGVGVVRMNLRGAGSGFGLARGIYHAGRSEDAAPGCHLGRRQSHGSPIALAGFSLGANLVLKLAAEAAEDPLAGLDCVLAANPPIDLAACARAMSRPDNRLYDWNFTRWLCSQAGRLHRLYPELGDPGLKRVSSVYEFDDCYTAARNGFQIGRRLLRPKQHSFRDLADRAAGARGPCRRRSFHPRRAFLGCFVSQQPEARAPGTRRPPGLRKPLPLARRSALARGAAGGLASRAMGLAAARRNRPLAVSG